MKKALMGLSLKNWNKDAAPMLTRAAGIVGVLAVWSDEFLKLLHEAPFVVAPEVDLWVKWLLKVAASVLALFTLLSKKQDNV